MSRQVLIARLRRLAEEAYAANEKEAASILYSLCGALAANAERNLMEVCAAHSQAMINALTAIRN